MFFDEGNDQNIKICKFEETNVLVSFVKRLRIENIYLKDIFDKSLYTDLYIL